MSEVIEFACTFCRHVYQTQRGASATCPVCGTTVTVAQQSADESRRDRVIGNPLRKKSVCPANPNGLNSWQEHYIFIPAKDQAS